MFLDALAALTGRPATKEIWRSQRRLFGERAPSEPNEATAETAFRLARAPERRKTTVGRGANPWGLSVFYGNVAEWRADLAEIAGGKFGSSPEQGARAIRGGSWRKGSGLTTRSSASPDYKGNWLGVRLAWEARW